MSKQLRDFSETIREGSNLLFLSDVSKKIGFCSLGVKLNLKRLNDASLPCAFYY